MTKKDEDAKCDAVLLRMLNTPPTPHKPVKAKPKKRKAEKRDVER